MDDFHAIMHGIGVVLEETGAFLLLVIFKDQLYDIYIYHIPVVPHGWRKFQNRKPIGEIRCCESQMSEQSNAVPLRIFFFNQIRRHKLRTDQDDCAV